MKMRVFASKLRSKRVNFVFSPGFTGPSRDAKNRAKNAFFRVFLLENGRFLRAKRSSTAVFWANVRTVRQRPLPEPLPLYSASFGAAFRAPLQRPRSSPPAAVAPAAAAPLRVRAPPRRENAAAAGQFAHRARALRRSKSGKNTPAEAGRARNARVFSRSQHAKTPVFML